MYGFLKLGRFSKVCIIKIKFDALYHLDNFKNKKNTHGGVLLLVKLQNSLKVHGLRNCVHDDERARNVLSKRFSRARNSVHVN